MAKSAVVDADGHVLEPADMWERYLEPKFRDRAIRLGVDKRGFEYVEIDRRKSGVLRGGALGGLGGAYQDMREVMTPGRVTYAECCRRTPGAVDPKLRIKELDAEGIDIAILYPTIGICWEGECDDPELAAAYCRAYNNWLFDYCSVHPDRLIAIAHINLRDVNLAVAELKRVKGKAKGIFLTPHIGNGRAHGDPYYDPFWAACEAAGLPVGSHVQVRPDSFGTGLYHSDRNPPVPEDIPRWFYFMQLAEDSMLGLNCIFQGGVLSRFPKVNYVVLETGCGWLPGWMDRADGKYELFAFTTRMPKKPSEIFRERCWISTDVDEASIPYVAGQIGANKMMWATDYPHLDAHKNPLRELHKNIGHMSEEDQQWILGRTAVELYNL
jgi:uncharacterized protein